MDLCFICFVLLIEITKQRCSPYIIKYMGIDSNRMISYESYLKTTLPSNLKIIEFYSCIIAPIAEEFIFRYIPYAIFSGTVHFIIAVPVFGLFHMVNYSNYLPILTKSESLKLAALQSFNTSVTGFLLYLLQVRYDTIYPSILFHMLCNLYQCFQLYKIINKLIIWINCLRIIRFSNQLTQAMIHRMIL